MENKSCDNCWKKIHEFYCPHDDPNIKLCKDWTYDNCFLCVKRDSDKCPEYHLTFKRERPCQDFKERHDGIKKFLDIAKEAHINGCNNFTDDVIQAGLNENTLFLGNVYKVLSSMYALLQKKNQRYGNSASNPLRIFSKADACQGIYVRLDDKLSRIKNSNELRKNDVADLIGYLALLCAEKEWTDFSDLVD